MQRRPLAGYLAVVLSATLLSPVVLRPAPALAHTTCAAGSETDYYPSTSPWSDGTKVRIRMVSPVSGAGCSKPAAGWPLVIYLHGWADNRCENMSFAARSTIATWGYVVLSFTARGKPLSSKAGAHGCDAATDAADALDDGGTDYAGPRDMQDITQLINWARDNYTPSGCADQCVDDSKVGVTGFSYGGQRSWMMGVPGPPGHPTHPGPNANFDDRVKAIAPVAGISNWINLRNMSSDGATPTANYRRFATGQGLWWPTMGWEGHTVRDVNTHFSEAIRYWYRKPSDPLPTATRDWLDSIVTVDDDNTTADGDPAVDKASLITIPTFVFAGWLDGFSGIHNSVLIEAYNKLTTSDKYLYVGSCAHSPDPCHTYDPGTGSNASRMRDALHRFFDRHVRADTTVSVGGPIFYTIPPKYLSATNNPWTPTNQAWTESTASAWPPSGSSTYTLYLRDDGKMLTTSEPGTTCTLTPTPDGCKAIANNIDYPASVNACYGLTYGSTEYQQYETDAFASPGKMGAFEADLWLSTDTTRVQVYVDAFVVTSAGTETRIWQGGRVVPTNRTATAGTPYRFVFKPGGAAWTFDTNQKLRIKVASKFSKLVQPEPGPSTYTLYHNDTYKSNVKVTFVP